jgi:hypothetical protein
MCNLSLGNRERKITNEKSQSRATLRDLDIETPRWWAPGAAIPGRKKLLH